MSHTQITGAHERLMKSVQQELEAFERRESQFRAEDRKERAEEIHLDVIEAHAMQMASIQRPRSDRFEHVARSASSHIEMRAFHL